MKKLNIIKGLVAMLLLAFVVTSCEDVPSLISDVGADRVFTPIGLKASVAQQTNVTVSWTARKDVDHYVVDFSADDPNFTTIFKTINVSGSVAQPSITVALEGLTTYSIRMKAVSSVGLADSQYDIVTAKTLGEQLFLPSQNGDIQATSAILRWVPNTNATNITVTPGNINHIITAAEKTSGIATITGLTGEVTYTATLMNGTKPRGTMTFKTAVDIGNGILIHPTDDLNSIFTNAKAGDKFYLEPGDYTVFKGAITLIKPISIYGLRSYDKPKVHLNFFMESGATDLKLQDIDFYGDSNGVDFIKLNSAAVAGLTYGDVMVSGCNVHDYTKTLFYGGVTVKNNQINSVKFDNCVITNIATAGATSCIDFRQIYPATISLTNSTFNNTSTMEFIRIDAGADYSGKGLTATVLVDKCTISNKGMTTNTNRILYVRFLNNISTVRNTLFADNGVAIYTNQSATAAPTFLNNNYYNSTNLYTLISPALSGQKIDGSGTYTTLDPKFVDAANGNFKVQNQTLINNAVGDPRWLQ